MFSREAIRTAIAIIENKGDIFLQKRDNVPGVTYPGMLMLFGGGLEDQESPQDGIIRELKEETSLDLDRSKLHFLWDQDFVGIGLDGEKILRHPHVFHLAIEEDDFEVYEGAGYVRVNTDNFAQYKENTTPFSAVVIENFWKGVIENVPAN